ncbi:hypothetical protein HK104_000163 [Borealophlyctis nickersoniae]|nr:hypothetical protein HK104_000163 [Borealophlyctis nickersoniae]
MTSVKVMDDDDDDDDDDDGNYGSGADSDGFDGFMGQGENIPSAYKDDEGALPSYHVVEDYHPKKRDDMRLRPGDQVTISMPMEYAPINRTHINLALRLSRMGGAMAIVDPKRRKTTRAKSMKRTKTSASTKTTSSSATHPPDVSLEPASPVSPGLPPPVPEGKGKLLFSMVPADQALEIVASSLSAERRAQYFETLLRTAHSGSSPLTTPTEEKTDLALRASMEGAAGEESKGKLGWRKLRVGWKDAVRKELENSHEYWKRQGSKFDIWAFMAENYRMDEPPSPASAGSSGRG